MVNSLADACDWRVFLDGQHSYRGLLTIRGLPALLLAATLSRLAGRMLSLALVLFVLARFSSPRLAGWVTFASIAPGLAFSPVAGALLDRMGPVIAVRIDLVAGALFALAVSLAGWSGLVSPVGLFLLAALLSLTGPLGWSGVRVLLPRLVPPVALDRVNAMDTAIYGVVDILGPGLAGLAVGWLGPEPAMLLIAAAYGGAALCLSRVRRLPVVGHSRMSLFHQAIEGVAAVARQPVLRGLAVSYSLYQVTWGALAVVVPVFAAARFGEATGSSVAGLVWAAMGAAGGLGALLAGHLRTAGRERLVMAAGMVVTALAAWPVAAAFGLGGLAIGLMLAGVVSGPIDVALLTLRQRQTHPHQLGRVLSISMSLNLVGFPLGSAIAGMLVTASPSGTFLLAGLASVIAAVASLSIPGDAVRPALGIGAAPD